MEHRSALIVNAERTIADGHAEGVTAVECWRGCRGSRRRTVAADKVDGNSEFGVHP